jgi:hypothetical protein
MVQWMAEVCPSLPIRVWEEALEGPEFGKAHLQEVETRPMFFPETTPERISPHWQIRVDVSEKMVRERCL